MGKETTQKYQIRNTNYESKSEKVVIYINEKTCKSLYIRNIKEYSKTKKSSKNISVKQEYSES